MLPRRRMTSGELETCCERNKRRSYIAKENQWYCHHALHWYPIDELYLVLFPVLVKVIKTFRREADGSSASKLELIRVEEIQEGILQDLSESRYWSISMMMMMVVMDMHDHQISDCLPTYTVTSLKGDLASPPMTALAMLPIPDCKGSKFSGRRPILTSCVKNSIKWPAMASDVASAGVLGPVLSGRLLSTMAITLSWSIGMAV